MHIVVLASHIPPCSVRCASFIFPALEPASSPNTSLAEFFRFAFLLTGNAETAGDVLTAALTETQARRAELKGREKCHAWLVAAIRRQCLERLQVRETAPPSGLLNGMAREGGDAVPDEAAAMATQIHALAEPERSAVALFYLDLCGPEEIAGMLDLNLRDFSEVLRRGRMHLRESAQSIRAVEPVI